MPEDAAPILSSSKPEESKSKKKHLLFLTLGIVGAAAVIGLILYFLSEASGESGCTNEPCSDTCTNGYCPVDQICVDGTCEDCSGQPCSEICVNGICPTGEICSNGICVNQCQGLGNPCQSNANCETCQDCVGGCCQTLIPNTIIQTTTLTGLVQYEGVLDVVEICDWSNMCFTTSNSICDCTNPNIWTATGQVQDSGGNPVPCVYMEVQSTDSNIGIYSTPGSTDENGNFSFTFGLINPQQYGVPCPFEYSCNPTTVTATINVTISGTNITVPFPVGITVYVCGC